MNELVAKSLNSYSHRLFLCALSERDRTALSELVEHFFCTGIAEEEHDEQL